jgi:hypothetical protein
MDSDTCILSQLRKVRLLPQEEHAGISPTAILFAWLGDQPVVLKIGIADPTDANGLEAERKIYQWVQQNMVSLSPHWTGGQQIGTCVEADFQRAGLGNPLPQIPNPSSRAFRYIVLPELQGIPLQALLDPDNKTTKALREIALDDPNFEPDLMIQVAQALTVAQAFQFRHNDMHPGNIFIKYSPIAMDLSYQYPYTFTLTTHWEIRIFDYNFATVQGNRNPGLSTMLGERSFTECQRSTRCNDWVENWDWYFFTRTYLGEAEYSNIGYTLGLDDRAVFRTHGIFPCQCLASVIHKDKDGRERSICSSCLLDQDVLQSMFSPLDYLYAHVPV